MTDRTLARVFRAPGRVNLIGEHTDYNDGFVLPMAITRGTTVAAEARPDRIITLESNAYRDRVKVDLDRLPLPSTPPHWSGYVIGVAAVLEQCGHILRGADLRIRSDVPLGVGLSSSAALEVGAGFALLAVADPRARIDRPALALACQRAEHLYAGTRCGIMDQFTACVGRRDRVLLLDTRSLSSDWLPLPSGVRVAVCNTMMRHELAGSEYNARRADCEAGVQALRRRLPGVRALRDVTLDDLDTIRTDVPERILRRCRFVVAENARVLAAADALREHKLPDFGRLMHRSHAGLRDEYEVSCRELDVMVEQASRQPGVYGARLTGGGFGGSVVALVDSAQADAFSEEAARGYRTATGIDPEIYMLEADDGVREI